MLNFISICIFFNPRHRVRLLTDPYNPCRGCLKSSYETKSENQALPLIRQLPEGLIFSNFTRHLPGKGQKVAENLVLFLFRQPRRSIHLYSDVSSPQSISSLSGQHSLRFFRILSRVFMNSSKYVLSSSSACSLRL